MASSRIVVRPRLQIETFSLYWKESLRTETQVLPEVGDRQAPLHACMPACLLPVLAHTAVYMPLTNTAAKLRGPNTCVLPCPCPWPWACMHAGELGRE